MSASFISLASDAVGAVVVAVVVVAVVVAVAVVVVVVVPGCSVKSV